MLPVSRHKHATFSQVGPVFSVRHLVLRAGLGLSLRWRGGASSVTGPLLTDQRRSQRHAVQLLDVEEEEELKRVH